MSEMKLLIVDDEHETRDGLLRSVSKMGYEFSSILTAQDGHMALEMTETFTPDILLCDIRMPKMDGLELAAALLKKNEDIRIIFISGYADKEYLKTAVALKADSYIEKPIEIDELSEAIKRSIKLFEKRKNEKNEKRRLADIADIYSRNQILKELLSEQNSINTKIVGSFENWPEKGGHVAHIFHLEWKKELEPQRKDTNIQQLLILIERELSQSVYCNSKAEKLLCGIISQEMLGAVVQIEEVDWHLVKLELKKFVMLLPSRMKSLFSIRIVVSRKANNIKEISKALLEARGIVKWGYFIENKNRIIYCNDTSNREEVNDKSGQFEKYLQKLNIFQAKQIIYKQTKELSEKDSGNVKKITEYYKKLLKICMDSEVVSRNYTENERRILSSFYDLRSLKQISEFIMNRIDDMYPKISIPSDVSPKISAAIQYIWEKIDDPMLSINSIADKLGLSKNYLNSVYKMETGKSLHQSIIEIRVECSKHLLLQDYKLYEISQKVGFTDPTYFSTVFKKQTGISPTQYRNEKSENIKKVTLNEI